MKQEARTFARALMAITCAMAFAAALMLSGCGSSSSTSSSVASDAKPFGSTHSGEAVATTSAEAPSEAPAASEAAPASETPGTQASSEAVGVSTPSESAPSSEAPSDSTPAVTPVVPQGSEGMLEKADDAYQDLKRFVDRELEERTNGEPQHLSLGEEAVVTENLAVRVVAVEAGPYDYEDSSPTVKVTVQMRNTSSHAVMVKASNWDADNSYGLRVDHKLWVKDELGNRVATSFEPVRISPGATYTGVVYFDGEDLVSVIYEPHWMVSSQNQYIYFDL